MAGFNAEAVKDCGSDCIRISTFVTTDSKDAQAQFLSALTLLAHQLLLPLTWTTCTYTCNDLSLHADCFFLIKLDQWLTTNAANARYLLGSELSCQALIGADSCLF